MNIFIDTNIFLSFYHLSNEDLEELKKLIVLLQNRQATLWLPDQVVNEFWRNREIKIADALKGLQDQKLNLQFPLLCKDYSEYSELRQHQKQYSEKHARLIQSILRDIASEQLKADITIHQLFESANKVNVTTEIIDRARLRHDIGNPPGKRDSLGDAINWETLITCVPEGDVLFFIAHDKDYSSPLEKQSFNTFLLSEWRLTKRSDIIYYQYLSSFFKEHFPHIKLATELEKDFLIQLLANSSSFASTHTTIAKLSRYTDFTIEQINYIVQIYIDNSQIYSILEDEDVSNFVEKLITEKEDKIDADNLQHLKRLIERANAKSLEVEDFDNDYGISLI